MEQGKKWSEMTVAEHLDAAQRLFDAVQSDRVNGLNQGIIKAQCHVAAAQALAGV